MSRRKGKPGDLISATLTWFGALVMFAPIAWMVLTSFKTERDAVSFPPKLFFTPTLEGRVSEVVEI